MKYQRSYSVNTFTRCTGQHLLWQPLVKRPSQNVILNTFSRLRFLFCMRVKIFFEELKSISVISRTFHYLRRGLGPTTWNRLQFYPYTEVWLTKWYIFTICFVSNHEFQIYFSKIHMVSEFFHVIKTFSRSSLISCEFSWLIVWLILYEAHTIWIMKYE